MYMDYEYIENLDIPISIKKFGKEDIRFISQEPTGEYVPTYAQDVVDEYLSLTALQTKKTATFPWNSSATVKEPLANKMYLDDGYEAVEETPVEANSINNLDPEADLNYEEGTAI